jgi:hypothetical protein
MEKNYSRDEIYPYLIQSLHSSKTAEDFFRNHLDDEHLLSTLIEVARNDESDDARMEAAFWVSQFGVELLRSFKRPLEQISQDGWESVASHARVALNKIANIKTTVAAA